MRHRNYLGELTEVSTDLDRADATFILRRGLSGDQHSVSFESVNYPDHYLRHQGFRIKLHRNDGTELFRKDASFIYNAAFVGGGVSLQSVNFPGFFIRHSNFELWIAKPDGTQLFTQDASFHDRPGFVPLPAAPPPAGAAVPPEWADMLKAHNDRRRLHCVPPLQWSPDLARAAQDYANTCTLGTHGSSGENMADWVTIRNGQPVLPAATNVQIFENVWYCEIDHYNFNAPAIAGGFKRNCDPPVNGHFTQVVWRSTTQIGCGKATCTIGGQQGTHWVCRYAPPGNVNTQEALNANVLRPTCQ